MCPAVTEPLLIVKCAGFSSVIVIVACVGSPVSNVNVIVFVDAGFMSYSRADVPELVVALIFKWKLPDTIEGLNITVCFVVVKDML